MARPKKLKPDAPATEVETIVHPADIGRKNIPTAETAALMAEEEARAEPKLYPRNPDLDPQLVWRGKDEQDSAPLRVETVPIYIQEKLYPEALIRDLQRTSAKEAPPQADLFGSFDRITDEAARLEFYQHAENWSNRMILGDSLLVMNSLAEKEGLRGQVQMIFLDPPYGIRFGSNWQPSTKKRQVEDGKVSEVSREPEQVKAFRDTWNDGVHSYLAYLRDRLVVARELLNEGGSIFVQIGDENVHVVRSLMDEVFGPQNHCGLISFAKTAGATSDLLPGVADYIVWYARDRAKVKFRQPLRTREAGSEGAVTYRQVQTACGLRRPMTEAERSGRERLPEGARVYAAGDLTSARVREGRTGYFGVTHEGREYLPSKREWSTHQAGMKRLGSAGRFTLSGESLRYTRFLDDFGAALIGNVWTDTGTGSFTDDKIYVVQTGTKVVQRCMLMTTDPGDLVLDPTCGSGTTAFVAEQWGRRWITTDTSRVALALARTRLMAGRFPAYLLRGSKEGAAKEGEITGRPPEEGPFRNDIRQGLVLERVPHVTLKSIANNAEIDVIHANWAPKIEAALAALNTALGTKHAEWQVPRTLPEDAKPAVQEAHTAFWAARRARQAEMDASIARNA
ncbi:MAG: site-specific DNA-methyltransferase, partial [Alphaproteobacteria bacterium]